MAVRREKEEELKGMATLFEMKEYQIQGEVRLESCARESGYQIITKYDDLMEGGKTFMSKD